MLVIFTKIVTMKDREGKLLIIVLWLRQFIELKLASEPRGRQSGLQDSPEDSERLAVFCLEESGVQEEEEQSSSDVIWHFDLAKIQYYAGMRKLLP